ncbi:MAG TPA: NAD-dependent epimerase/dehydratase family protein [Thermoleophilia bacterium]|nr:NAD-dependent epimerase/dehydratase family protein [Thermoleophilia bacterium]
MNWLMITGGAGFIGRHLKEFFPGAFVVDLRKPADEFLDVRDEVKLRYLVSHERPSVIIHLAALPGVAALDGLDTQVRGTHAVLRAADDVGARVVLASSAAVYSLPEFAETTAWMSEYALGKRLSEQLGEISPVSFCALRLANVYGPPWPKGVVAKFRYAALVRTTPTITDPSLTRDFVHVDDVVRAFAAAVFSTAQHPMDICTGVETSLLELWRRIAAFHGAPLDYHEGEPRPVDRPSSDTDPSEACETLQWMSQISLGEGILG